MTELPTEKVAPTPGVASEGGVGWPDAGHLADSVAAAVCMIPGVSRMHAGMFGEVATYLPGRRIIGVQLHDDVAAIHVVLAWGIDIAATADSIRAAVVPLLGTPVEVTVQDLAGTPNPS